MGKLKILVGKTQTPVIYINDFPICYFSVLYKKFFININYATKKMPNSDLTAAFDCREAKLDSQELFNFLDKNDKKIFLWNLEYFSEKYLYELWDMYNVGNRSSEIIHISD